MFCPKARIFFFLMLLSSLTSFGMQDCIESLFGFDDSREFTCSLHEAVIDGDIKTVRSYVVNNIFDVNELDMFGETPLHKASDIKNSENRYAIVQALLQGKADPNRVNSSEKRSSLYRFVICDYAHEVNVLLDHKADIGLQDYHGNTIFHSMAHFIKFIDRKLYHGFVLEKCFNVPLLRLKTFLLCKKKIERDFKIKIPRSLVHIIACLADPVAESFFNSTFNKSLAKINDKGKTAYDILSQDIQISYGILQKKEKSPKEYQSWVKLLKPLGELSKPAEEK